MITYKKEIETFEDLKELCWSGAVDRLDEIEELGLQDEFMYHIESYFDDSFEEATLTEINDFIWFECDTWVEEHREQMDEDEEE